ncbi:hypothetical protein CBL_01345 [Carabus blaptoides fortunei]
MVVCTQEQHSTVSFKGRHKKVLSDRWRNCPQETDMPNTLFKCKSLSQWGANGIGFVPCAKKTGKGKTRSGVSSNENIRPDSQTAIVVAIGEVVRIADVTSCEKISLLENNTLEKASITGILYHCHV